MPAMVPGGTDSSGWPHVAGSWGGASTCALSAGSAQTGTNLYGSRLVRVP